MLKKSLKNKTLIPKPPTVVILGHVDSGKTSLLDFIRQSNVASTESGGITQHIGAYQIKHQDKIINFIDTPGHEAFSAMRTRGAKVADIAILIVACDQGVKPQTKEALKAIREANIPFIVALNKIDVPGTFPQKTKKELSDCQVALEEFGGQVPLVEISAKNGQGVDSLLEMVNLITEIEDLTYDPSLPGQGIIIEAHLDPRRGPTITALINNGTLRSNDIIIAGNTYGKIKTMEDTNLKSIKLAAAQPVIITGLENVPAIGSNLKKVKTIAEARQITQQYQAIPKITQKINPNTEDSAQSIAPDQTFNLILKVDVAGSQEAIEACLNNIPQQEINLNILRVLVGDINESDVKLAMATGAHIIGFRVKTDPPAQALANHQKIWIKTFQVIYELVEVIRKGMSQLLSPEVKEEILGQGRVIAIFKQEKNAIIFGAKIIQGKFLQGIKIKIWRNDEIIGQGRIKELQFEKKKIKELKKDKNAGIFLEGFNNVTKGDKIEAYQEIREKREL